jgi:hypothetical protein
MQVLPQSPCSAEYSPRHLLTNQFAHLRTVPNVPHYISSYFNLHTVRRLKSSAMLCYDSQKFRILRFQVAGSDLVQTLSEFNVFNPLLHSILVCYFRSENYQPIRN